MNLEIVENLSKKLDNNLETIKILEPGTDEYNDVLKDAIEIESELNAVLDE